VLATTCSRRGWRVVANLARGLEVTGIDQLWVADITYIRLREEFAYLPMVLDALSRRMIGWALETHLEASLAIAALAMALAARRPAPGGLVHHSDRGIRVRVATMRVSSRHLSAPSSSSGPSLLSEQRTPPDRRNGTGHREHFRDQGERLYRASAYPGGRSNSERSLGARSAAAARLPWRWRAWTSLARTW
jgi:transposase InsO family protein